MTDERRGRAFPLVFLISFIVLVANVAGSTNVNDADKSPVSETQVLDPGTRIESNGEKSAGSPKTGEKSPQVFSEETVRASIIAEEDGTEDEIPAGDDEQEEGEEYEGEEEGDEYAEELRAAAESHEAMSRHDKQSTNQTNPSGDSRGSVNRSDNLEQHKLDGTKKDFDSREKSVESGSDEDDSSNETIVEGAEGDDDEVTELIKYRPINQFKVRVNEREDSVKTKRIPTVKKELSTQAEIKIANVSAKQEKRFSTKEALDELNKQLKHSMGYTEEPSEDETTSIVDESVDKTEEVLEDPEADDYFEQNLATANDKRQADSKLGDLESGVDEEPRKMDKRQEAVLRDLETYLRAEYAAEQEQQQKLQELGAQEGALAESLLELLVKLAENPRRWERVHRLLMDVEGGLELSRQALEARKRAFNLTSVVTTTTTTSPVSTAPKKPRKKPKKKKKKKKQRHHRLSTSTTTVPTIIPLLTTTEAPWLTTPMQWRLVAERLFGPPWPQDLQDDPGVAKVRFTVPANSRTSTPSREFVEQLGDSKQLQDHKALNTERQALMLESSREYTQPRHLHYGKVNTHQGVSSHREQSTPMKYHSGNRENSRVRDYDPPERTSADYDIARYGQYEYPRTRIQGEDYFPVQSYAQNHEYRPPGREYAASKSWHDTQYKYGRPSWKSDDRSVDSSAKWTWPQIEEEPKPGWRRGIQNQREYWPRAQDENDGKVWPLQTQRSGLVDGWGRMTGADSWTKSASWPNEQAPKSQYERDRGGSPPWETGKTRTESSTNLGRVGLNEGTKMSVKSWTGLPAEQETWPFKLTGKKPWAKNTEEKSYSQNSAAVRKLGSRENGGKVDTFDKSLQKDSKSGDNSKYKNNAKAKSKAQKNPDHRLDDQMNRMNPWNTEINTNSKTWPPKAPISPKIQSVGAWVMPVDQSTWKPYDLKPVDSYQGNNEGDPNRHRWNVEMDTNPRTWPPKMGDDQWNKFGKPASSVTWPKWKQFAYHRVTAMPILSQGAALQDGSRARNNAYIAVSAVSPKYNGNQWRKNDIEETPVGQSGSGNPPGLIIDTEHPVSQLRGSVEPAPIYTWKKDGSAKFGQSGNRNSTDPLEEQLETLRRGTSWSHNENRDNIEKQLNVISDASATLASRFSSNSSVNREEVHAVTTAVKDDKKFAKIDQQ